MIQNFGLAIFEEDEFIAISQLSPTLNQFALEIQHDVNSRKIVDLESGNEFVEFFQDLVQVFNYFKSCQSYEKLKVFVTGMVDFFSLSVVPDERKTLFHIQDILNEEYYSDEEDYATKVYERQTTLKVPMRHPIEFAIEEENTRFLEVLMECPFLGMISISMSSSIYKFLGTHIICLQT